MRIVCEKCMQMSGNFKKGWFGVFERGEFVVCGNKGVCSVEDITTLDISGVDKKRE